MNLQGVVKRPLSTILLPDSILVVGVSGGADSLALLHLLHSIYGAERLVVAHLDHSLRPLSSQDARFVEQTAVSWNIPSVIEKRNVASWASDHQMSIEEAGRTLRYRFFARVARQVGAIAIAVAHHADDQAETVLMHLLRGSGLAGLQGMQMVRPLPWADELMLIRPFLSVSRATIEAYCKTHELTPVVDESNEDISFFRNRIRHQLLPLLSSYSPRIKKHLHDLAEIVAADYALLQTVLEETWTQILLDESDSWRRLDLKKWLSLPLSLKRGTLRYAVAQIRPLQQNIGFRSIDLARLLIEKGHSGAEAMLPGGLFLQVGAQTLTIADDLLRVPVDLPQLPENPPIPRELPIPGELELEDGWWLTAVQLETVDLSAIEQNEDVWQAFVAIDEDVLLVRGRQAGERYQPLGMAGHSAKLRDVMINRKIPAAVRDRWPIVALPDQLVWFVGHQIDERVCVTAPSASSGQAVAPRVVHLICQPS